MGDQEVEIRMRGNALPEGQIAPVKSALQHLAGESVRVNEG